MYRHITLVVHLTVEQHPKYSFNFPKLSGVVLKIWIELHRYLFSIAETGCFWVVRGGKKRNSWRRLEIGPVGNSLNSRLLTDSIISVLHYVDVTQMRELGIWIWSVNEPQKLNQYLSACSPMILCHFGHAFVFSVPLLCTLWLSWVFCLQ